MQNEEKGDGFWLKYCNKNIGRRKKENLRINGRGHSVTLFKAKSVSSLITTGVSRKVEVTLSFQNAYVILFDQTFIFRNISNFTSNECQSCSVWGKCEC